MKFGAAHMAVRCLADVATKGYSLNLCMDD